MSFVADHALWIATRAAGRSTLQRFARLREAPEIADFGFSGFSP